MFKTEVLKAFPVCVLLLGKKAAKFSVNPVVRPESLKQVMVGRGRWVEGVNLGKWLLLIESSDIVLRNHVFSHPRL